MSEFNWKFTIECPFCGAIEHTSDECETDDWSEAFVFSGASPTSYKGSYIPYDPNWTCRECKRSIPRDDLYRNANIKTESIEASGIMVEAWHHKFTITY